jgi:hypothetical protein
MGERGATEEEIEAATRDGERIPPNSTAKGFAAISRSAVYGAGAFMRRN